MAKFNSDSKGAVDVTSWTSVGNERKTVAIFLRKETQQEATLKTV